MKIIPGKKAVMEMQDIMHTIRTLARSQGFYSGLYNYLCNIQENDPVSFDDISLELEAQEFHSAVDVVLYFET